MNNEEQILIAMEEVSNQLNEIKKAISRPASSTELNLSPINDQLYEMKDFLKKISFEGQNRDNEYNRIKSTLMDLRGILLEKQREVTHKYIEVKKPHRWILGVATYFIISLFICIWAYQTNQKLAKRLQATTASDFKYRFLKLQSFDMNYLRKNYNNSTELVYSIDDYYSKHKEELETYVIKREAEIKRMNEANAIAKQKEQEAEKAREEVNRIKSKYSKGNQ